ncbi:MAG: acetyltransferase [Sphingomonas sp.]|nr:acetyltransferase [Sphingomonas sp.]MDX3884432.1 acetyltransferase [Sphingomonas sp.]
MTMRIRRSRPADVARLHVIWREAVLATHDFLSAEDFAAIDAMVRDAYLPRAALWVAVDGEDRPVAFMGLSEAHVDSLFVDPAMHGRGIGAAMIDHARGAAGLGRAALSVDVNEQNDKAVGFYAHLGFRVAGRSERDDEGRPYPLLHMTMA